eukprot:TRINITY_DN10895_c0_g1_i1.p1 TRINITY_DN10895_c0_g1~~TRINITY_DN10895_c0_g1_i1.p1  ORF type:complete len:296 (+),score=103.08 TRINITY_DN10895_c0_g1_i1:136-1023(+)
MEESSVEIKAKLQVYKEQLEQLAAALKIDASNEELKNMHDQLGQVVALTETMLQLRVQQEKETSKREEEGEAVVTTRSTSASAASNLKKNVGEKCFARWSGDNQYYEAVIDSVNDKDDGEVTYTVTFLGYGTTEEVKAEALSATPNGEKANSDKDENTTEKSSTKKKRKVLFDEEGNVIIPKNLQANPNDSKEARALKKKKVHAIRSTARFQKIDEEHSQRKSDWQSFMNVKGKEKKTGFFTGRKQESIFKSPDNPMGKVGVTGSGKPMTEPITFEKPKPSPSSSVASSLMKLPL